MSRKRFHGLKKVKVRATWSKYNLYNLSRLRIPPTTYQTAFQQRWSGKSITRAYHGEHIREKQWQRMFRPHLNAVIPMDHRYLAEHDGSELASGRGSGRDKPTKVGEHSQSTRSQIPYMNMTYAPIERRLDMAIWRALFASSARQARQFVIHGNVKVNGQKMPYPGYLLNPGDMFQVEMDRVLYATGAKKEVVQSRNGRKLRKMLRRRAKETKPGKVGMKAKKALVRQQLKEAEEVTESGVEEPSSVGWQDIMEIRAQRREDFSRLLTQLENAMTIRLKVKRKQELRALKKELLGAMRNVGKKTAKTLDDELNSLLARMTIYAPSPEQRAIAEAEAKAKAETAEAEARSNNPSPEYLKALREAMTRARENPVDESKPYATPWKPRPYMSAFAFIPRYLEVNHNICSAVYLRHPVARPNLAEVPTPFPPDVQQLAFNWYLRRR